MLKSRIVDLKKIDILGFDHFLEIRTFFILIKKKKILLKIKSCGFRWNNARYKKMFKSKIIHLKEIYNFDFDHFLIKRTVFVLIVKNVIKNKKFNFPDKLCDICTKKMLRTKLFVSKRSTNFWSNFIRCEKMIQIKVVVFKKLYKFYTKPFLIGILVFLINIKNAIK